MRTKMFILTAISISLLAFGCKKNPLTDSPVIARTQSLATLNTSTITSITSTTAISGGNIIDDGGSNITSRGICWSTTSAPTISGNHISNGTNTGTFSANIIGLLATTNYYVRAYATNSSGTSYGNELSFVTSSTPATIYIGGQESNGTKTVAKYWKNGTAISLTDGTKNAGVKSMLILGNDVYAGGFEFNTVNIPVAKYWKNGIPVNLTDGTKFAFVNALAVVGNDVYAAGSETNGAGTKSFARYWKNGTAITLTNGTYEAEIRSLVVIGTDVYAAGSENNISGKSVAKYWKNGIAVNITDGTKTASALAFSVLGSDVYAAGYENTLTLTTTPVNPVAKYWKNSTAVVLGNTTVQYSVCFALALAGNDVYAGGYEKPASIRSATYWKNGLPVSLTDGTKNSVITSMAIVGNDVYASGYEENSSNIQVAKYWKNGVAINLSDGTKNAIAESMVVVP